MAEGHIGVPANKVASLLKNTSYVMVAEAGKPVLAFALVFFISHTLGQNGVGAYTIILTFAALFELVATAGLCPLITRTVAANRSQIPYLLNGCVGVAAAAAAIVVPAMLLILRWFHYSQEISSAIELLAITILLATIQQYAIAFFEGLQAMRLRAIVSSLDTFGKVGLGLAMLALAKGVPGIIHAYVFTRFLSCIIAIWVLSKRVDLHLDLRMIRAATPKMFRAGVPFLCMTVTSTIFWSITTLVLSKLASTSEVGQYNAGYRIMDILRNVLNSYLIALLPAMSASFANNLDELRGDCDRSLKYLALITVPIATGVCVLSSKIVVLVYGPAFASSGPILQVLVWTLVLFCLGLVFARVLIASHNQVADLYCNLGALAVNVLVGTYLIRHYGPLGAGFTTLISLFAFVVLEGAVVAKKLFRFALWRSLAQAAAASAIMAAVITLLGGAPLFLLILAGVIVYAVVLLSIGTFTRTELSVLGAIVKKTFQALKRSAVLRVLTATGE
jgi:O-antigen/teichoic acid export membrane protein